MNQSKPAEAQAAPLLPRGSAVEHSIEIQAPAALIWQYLEDVDSWSRWNPIYRQASGSIRLGETIDLFVAIPGIKAQQVVSKVLLSIPTTQLRYGAPGLGGLIRATRYVEIVPTSPQACTVTNGEVMAGPLGRILGRVVGTKIREGLRQMNVGLKEAAERKWREPS